MRSFPPWLFAAAFSVALAAGASAHGSDESRRFFDFTAVSAANPAVAVIDGAIEIPLSELRGYRDAERPHAITDPQSLAQKRAVLDALLDEYLYVDEAYRAGVPEQPAFVRRMEATRTMLLTDFMAMRAAIENPRAGAAADEAAPALAEQLFERASIEVSNEAFALLKQGAAAIDRIVAERRASLEPGGREEMAALHGVIARTPDAVLVRYDDQSISVRPMLALYAGLPAAKRPPVQTEAGLIALIKPQILPELMAREAARRGIAQEPAFQQKVIQNRNALLRFHVHGAIEARANDLLRSPQLEAKLREYYQAHRTLYAAAPESGASGLIPFASARDRVLADYSVDVRDELLAQKARALRKNRRVTIDEAVLARL